jgi:hypothetical protein
MQDFVLFYVPLAPVASLARDLSSSAAWFKLTFVLDVLADVSEGARGCSCAAI